MKPLEELLGYGPDVVRTNISGEIIKYLDPEKLTKNFIDIGSSDGYSYDPTFSLFVNNWNGYYFEWDIAKFKTIKSSLRNHDNVHPINVCVTPNNILDLLEINKVDKFDAFSIDIDGYDYFVVKKLLENFSPTLAIVECNTIFIPPIIWTVLYKEDLKWSGTSHFLGCSAKLYDLLFQKHGYEIIFYDWENAYYIKKEYSDRFGVKNNSISEMWNKGYWKRPNRGQNDFFSWNNDFNSIVSNSNQEYQMKFIKEHPHIKQYVEGKDYLLFPNELSIPENVKKEVLGL